MILEIKNKIEQDWQVDLSSKNRDRKHSYLRAIYFDVAYNITDCTTAEIGETVNRDHSTVLHGKSKIMDVVHFSEPEMSRYTYDLFEFFKGKGSRIIQLQDKIKKLQKELEELQNYKK